MNASEDILISIIIPTLNEQKLIEQTLSQFTPEIKNKYKLEVVVSDGNSTDGTADIALKYADRVVTSDKLVKQNIAKGRNLGAQSARGRLLYLMNADTLIGNMLNFFDTTIKAFEDDSVAALTCKVKVFKEEERTADKIFHFSYNSYVRTLNALGMGMGRGECHLIRREAFFHHKGYNEAMAAGEDYDLYRRIAKTGKIRFLKSLTVYESPRRYRKFGYPKVFWDWTKNAASVLFKNKAISDDWEQVR